MLATHIAVANYAVTKLAALGVQMYLDAGHAGWLGWPANLTPAAQLFARVYQNAGKPAQLRGLATSKPNPQLNCLTGCSCSCSVLDVANYNALRAASPDPATQGNPNYDEIHYIEVRSGTYVPCFILSQWYAR